MPGRSRTKLGLDRSGAGPLAGCGQGFSPIHLSYNTMIPCWGCFGATIVAQWLHFLKI